MSRSEALKRAQSKYQRKISVRNILKQYNFKFHIVHDADIIKVLESQKNKNGYIKKLIRDDMQSRDIKK
jgi:hypothetical protein